MKAENRLLDVADREYRSDGVVGRVAGKKLTGQRPDYAPLLQARILSLVDQEVVDPAVELVQYPRCIAFLLEQPRRRSDQVVEIENRPSGFEPIVPVVESASDSQDGRRCPRRYTARNRASTSARRSPSRRRMSAAAGRADRSVLVTRFFGCFLLKGICTNSP